jgi:hypothetical protein
MNAQKIKELLQTITESVQAIMAEIGAAATGPVETPFGTIGVPSGGKIFPTVPHVVPPPAALIDYGDFVDDPTKSYHPYVQQAGIKALVESIRYSLESNPGVTLYPWAVDLKNDWQQYFA